MDTTRNSVLIIEDQKTTITVLTKILSPEYTIYSAENGQEGIKAAELYLPDLILLDILMLEMDGFAVISILKKSDITKDIPVIFITSLTGDADEEKGLALGAADYITKPFTPAIVKLRLHNQIMMLDQLRTIKKLSMIDLLTDLPNRRSFEERIESEWARASREQKTISILMIDVDRFKNFNDAFGHLLGDSVLQSIANVFNQTLKRPGDFAARWGGEEFVILLPDTDSNGALDIAEQIRKRTEEMEVSDINTPKGKITISVGVNTHKHGQSGTIYDFLSGADTALYKAKDLGRNKVCNYVKE